MTGLPPYVVVILGTGFCLIGLWFQFYMGQIFKLEYRKKSTEQFITGLFSHLSEREIRPEELEVNALKEILGPKVTALVDANSSYEDKRIDQASREVIDLTLRQLKAYDKKLVLSALTATWKMNCRIVYVNGKPGSKGMLDATRKVLEEYSNSS
jgi:hypothetical protein